MAQGKAWDKEKIIEVLKPYFQLGCSVRKACMYAGIAESTFQTWVGDDPELRVQIEAWRNEINAKARANIRARVASGDYGASKDWLERIEKDEFSLRNEHTGADGKDLPTPILNHALQHNDSNTESNGTQ